MKVPLLVVLLAVTASGQTPAAPANPRDARSTPRGTVMGFLEACQAGDYRRAALFLDLSAWPHSQRERQAPEIARQLKKVLDRKLSSSFEKLSGDPAGNLLDGLSENRELLGRVSLEDRKVDLYLERLDRDGRQVWLFASQTVALVPQLYEDIGNNAIEASLPSVLVDHTLFGAALWQWLALLILVPAVAAVARLVVWFALRIVRRIVRRATGAFNDALIGAFGPPVRLLVAILIFRIGMAWVAPPALMRVYLQRILGMIAAFAVAWLLSRLVDLGASKFVAAMTSKGKTNAISTVPLASRSLKVVIILGAVLATLDLWGYNTATLLTGLGIGGLAVALAAQKTIENLFGGVALITDQPVAVGDVCKFGDRVGTVEDIGLRSTRIRTPDRTVISVPNGQFSAMPLENVSRRDQIFFNHKLPLRRDATPDQIRQLLEDIDRVLSNHPKVAPGAKRVRFTGVGDGSLNLEIVAYVRTPNYDEFLPIQEELLLAILEQIEAVGTGLWVPSRLNLTPNDLLKPS